MSTPKFKCNLSRGFKFIPLNNQEDINMLHNGVRYPRCHIVEMEGNSLASLSAIYRQESILLPPPAMLWGVHHSPLLAFLLALTVIIF